MQISTLTTIKSILEIDPEITPDKKTEILQVCKTHHVKRELITVKEAAEILDCCKLTLRQYVKRGLLHPVYYSKRKVRYDKTEVLALANNGITAGE